jgi:hypothetical protein
VTSLSVETQFAYMFLFINLKMDYDSELESLRELDHLSSALCSLALLWGSFSKPAFEHESPPDNIKYNSIIVLEVQAGVFEYMIAESF